MSYKYETHTHICIYISLQVVICFKIKLVLVFYLRLFFKHCWNILELIVTYNSVAYTLRISIKDTFKDLPNFLIQFDNKWKKEKLSLKDKDWLNSWEIEWIVEKHSEKYHFCRNYFPADNVDPCSYSVLSKISWTLCFDLNINVYFLTNQVMLLCSFLLPENY